MSNDRYSGLRMRFNTKDLSKPPEDYKSTAYIPERFERAILKHIILNNTALEINNNQFPLLLGIQGPYGFGKTYMVKEICRKYKIELHPLSTSELSGSMEADSTRHLKRIYSTLCADIWQNKRCGVLLIDDFHLTIATEDTLGKTVNSNILAAYLMNLCDNPVVVTNVRAPIILTGNNFRRIYPAIVRDGRMDIFTWDPSIKEIDPIVRQLFRTKFAGVEDDVLTAMLDRYAEMNIAFFEQVTQDLMNSSVTQAIEAFKAAEGAMTVSQVSATVKSSLSAMDLSKEHVMEVCRLRKEATLVNFERSNLAILRQGADQASL
ncbi:MAG: AAA family ATPase [Clostridiales bacterium]|nr:AAA family ATPase [Clostridiales bacterium]